MNYNKIFPIIKKTRGRSLTKTVFLVCIVVLISALLILPLTYNSDSTNRKKTAKQIAQIEEVLGLFQLDNGFYPTTDQGLESLVKEPALPPKTRNYKKGGYIEKIKKDAWGYNFIYICPGYHKDFDIISYGSDAKKGGVGSAADITNWE